MFRPKLKRTTYPFTSNCTSIFTISKNSNMSNCNINDELQKAAVYDKNLEKVKELLSTGVDVNLRIGRNKGTLLHETYGTEITKELLRQGTEINARNMYSETALHSAIEKGKELELVRVLLTHKAHVNATDRKGNTALNMAVKKSNKNLKIIQELLEYGADINIRNRERRLYGNYATSLDNAVSDLACAKVLIKITLIKNFDRDHKKIIDLTPYTECRTYNELSRYLEDCINEILQMKTDKVNDKLTLYEVIKSASIKTLHAENNITDLVILTNYSIYHDIISTKIKLCLERARLLNKLSELQIYVRLNISNQDVTEKEVLLNLYSTYNIAKYLCNDDLLNLVTAFYKHNDQSVDLSENLGEISQEPDIKLAVSASSCTKRARLESPNHE